MGPSRCGSGAGIFAGARRQTSWLPKRPAGRVDKGRSVQVEPKCQAQVLGVSLTGGLGGRRIPAGENGPRAGLCKRHRCRESEAGWWWWWGGGVPALSLPPGRGEKGSPRSRRRGVRGVLTAGAPGGGWCGAAGGSGGARGHRAGAPPGASGVGGSRLHNGPAEPGKVFPPRHVQK